MVRPNRQSRWRSHHSAENRTSARPAHHALSIGSQQKSLVARPFEGEWYWRGRSSPGRMTARPNPGNRRSFKPQLTARRGVLLLKSTCQHRYIQLFEMFAERCAHMPDDPEVLAELIKAFAHPTRLLILRELMSGPKCVTDMEDLLPARQATSRSILPCSASPSSSTMPRTVRCGAITSRGPHWLRTCSTW